MSENQIIAEMKQTWQTLIDAPLPDDKQLSIWAAMFDLKTAKYGIVTLAAKYKRVQGAMDGDYMARYASSVMNRFAREQRGQTTKEAIIV